MVFALQFGEQTQFAIYHTRLILSGWMPDADAELRLSGLDLDTGLDNIVRQIGQITVENCNTLAERMQ